MTAAHADDGERRPFADASAAQVRVALIPEEAVEFDELWRAAMMRATDSGDLTEVVALLRTWRRIAWLTAERGAAAHRRMSRRAAAALTELPVPTDEPLRVTTSRLRL